MAKETKVRVGGSWRNVTEQYIRVGSTWRTVLETYVRVGGAWKLAYEAKEWVTKYSWNATDDGLPTSPFLKQGTQEAIDIGTEIRITDNSASDRVFYEAANFIDPNAKVRFTVFARGESFGNNSSRAIEVKNGEKQYNQIVNVSGTHIKHQWIFDKAGDSFQYLEDDVLIVDTTYSSLTNTTDDFALIGCPVTSGTARMYLESILMEEFE